MISAAERRGCEGGAGGGGGGGGRPFGFTTAGAYVPWLAAACSTGVTAPEVAAPKPAAPVIFTGSSVNIVATFEAAPAAIDEFTYGSPSPSAPWARSFLCCLASAARSGALVVVLRGSLYPAFSALVSSCLLSQADSYLPMAAMTS